MELLSLIASTTQRATVVSEQVLDRFTVPPFSFGDVLSGRVAVVEETGDPTQPTRDISLDSSSGVALTNGSGVVYASGFNIAIANVNEITFDIVIVGADLITALTDVDFIEAFLEVRITVDGQDQLLLREPVVITKSATAVAPVPVLPVRLLYNYTLTSLRGGGVTSLESMATVSLGTNTLLITIIDDQLQNWLLIDGAADPLDPDGEVAPLDYDLALNNRFWSKVVGL